ncbi:MAG TPA: enoyl-CoA hydratase-related protein [Candidatus Binatia bacterium]|nr:enoyl-CoA hydratase-related protein [Candidatus Binatia bacterium]
MLTAEHVHVERDGAVGVLTLDRRERFNSLDVATARDLRRAGLALARDEEVRVVLLRGADGVFCSGADLKYVHTGGAPEDLGYLAPAARDAPGGYAEALKEIVEYLHSTISEIRRAPKPFVAAVDGIAAAGGFGLAMACDLVLASERATFEWAYPRTGLTGAESATFFLPRLIGLRRAMELVLLSPRLDAAAALRMGLITAVHPTARLDAEARDLAARLAAGPAGAHGIAKALLNAAAGGDRLDAHLDRELDCLARVAGGRDFAEGLAAFLAKRPPRFDGG